MNDDYIGRQTVIDDLREILNDPNCPLFVSAAVHQILESIPAANVRPVVYGEWIFVKRVCDADECNCSICGQVLTTHAEERMDFCPKCGAYMTSKPNKKEE